MIGNTRGCGFWGAVHYFDRLGLKYPPESEMGKAQLIKQALASATTSSKGYHQPDFAGQERQRKGKLPRKPFNRSKGAKLRQFWPGIGQP